ncbi:MAG TPA: ABC transporter substrate-binding protein [Acetobacteraceae bacterium]|nr:ABC transporter substrate-binding protein [Acetobacteraceae bacterium]
MYRRTFLAGSAAALASPALARGAGANVLRFIPDADLSSLDPVWTTSYQTRDHGFLVYDTLFGQDATYKPTVQMLEGFVVEDDRRVYRMALRAGLKFHDGTPVLARDCIASIARWGKRDAYGQALMAAVAEMKANDDRRFTIRLKSPFPLLPDALSKTSPSMCPIMPERLAQTDPFKQVTEAIGSGPYRYKADERVPGAKVVYEKFAEYVPRSGGTADRTAGPKIANFDRIEWQIIPDASAAMGALLHGEVDWWYTPAADLLPPLRKAHEVSVATIVPTGTIATMRFNHLQPPFDNPAIRRALVGAVTQADYMTAVNGEDRSLWRDKVGFFCPDTPMASDAGMEALTSPRDLDRVKRGLAEAGYKDERVVLLSPQDIVSVKALAAVTEDLLKKLGMNVDAQALDWATAVQRRAKTDPVDQGGWSIFQTSWAGLDMFNPAGHVFLRANGRDAAPGWPSSPRLEALRNDWFAAEDISAQRKICEQIQRQAFEDVPYIPLGQSLAVTAYRVELRGMLEGLPLFWNIRRT